MYVFSGTCTRIADKNSNQNQIKEGPWTMTERVTANCQLLKPTVHIVQTLSEQKTFFHPTHPPSKMVDSKKEINVAKRKNPMKDYIQISSGLPIEVQHVILSTVFQNIFDDRCWIIGSSLKYNTENWRFFTWATHLFSDSPVLEVDTLEKVKTQKAVVKLTFKLNKKVKVTMKMQVPPTKVPAYMKNFFKSFKLERLTVDITSLVSNVKYLSNFIGTLVDLEPRQFIISNVVSLDDLYSNRWSSKITGLNNFIWGLIPEFTLRLDDFSRLRYISLRTIVPQRESVSLVRPLLQSASLTEVHVNFHDKRYFKIDPNLSTENEWAALLKKFENKLFLHAPSVSCALNQSSLSFLDHVKDLSTIQCLEPSSSKMVSALKVRNLNITVPLENATFVNGKTVTMTLTGKSYKNCNFKSMNALTHASTGCQSVELGAPEQRNTIQICLKSLLSFPNTLKCLNLTKAKISPNTNNELIKLPHSLQSLYCTPEHLLLLDTKSPERLRALVVSVMGLVLESDPCWEKIPHTVELLKLEGPIVVEDVKAADEDSFFNHGCADSRRLGGVKLPDEIKKIKIDLKFNLIDKERNPVSEKLSYIFLNSAVFGGPVNPEVFNGRAVPSGEDKLFYSIQTSKDAKIVFNKLPNELFCIFGDPERTENIILPSSYKCLNENNEGYSVFGSQYVSSIFTDGDDTMLENMMIRTMLRLAGRGADINPLLLGIPFRRQRRGGRRQRRHWLI
ncbi:unnamed protein product [Ambrosiozyma monospora]|uniref:Unnamed protein product n=1 Tax=Ambrosiozyma monospora TaxID=43982 RepID=A0A9W6YTS8_AMBMO|nr:unnamed protein product [Ambrosiozyma monospora]